MKGSQSYLLSENDLKKRGRGSHDYAVESNSGIITVRWYDNNCVQIISNYLANEAGENARRWNKKNTSFVEVERSMIVQVYHANMGGVDLCDILLSLYRIRQRTNKYFFHIVYYLLEISVTNGWLLYRRHQNQKSIPEKDQLSMLEFQTDIANDLRSDGKLAPASRRSRGRPSLNTTVEEPHKKRTTPTVPDPSNNTRFDKLDHFPVFQEKQQRCRKCRTGYSFIKCQKCGVALCLQNARNCYGKIIRQNLCKSFVSLFVCVFLFLDSPL